MEWLPGSTAKLTQDFGRWQRAPGLGNGVALATDGESD
jgi:hypothetical protein